MSDWWYEASHVNVRGGRKQAQKRLEMKQFWEGANGVVSGRGLKIMEQWGYSWEKGGLGDGKGRWGIGHFPDRWAQAPCPPALNALTAAMILASSSPPPPPPPNLLLPTPNLLLPPPTPCPTPFTVAPPKMSVPQLRHQRLFVPITTTTYLPPPCPPPPDHNNNNNNNNNTTNNNNNNNNTNNNNNNNSNNNNDNKQADGEGELVPPTEAEQDKVSFIFNNLSLMNLTAKMHNIREVLQIDSNEQHSSWLGHYLMKRASIEPNFHTLYASFLEVLKSEDIFDRVVKETYKKINEFLRGPKSQISKSLLKNLGHWLGLMLLARDKPILSQHLNLQHLIIDAFHNRHKEKQQELLHIVPFVVKVLESAAKSKVFKPPCSWTTGLMNLLAELHQEPDLKLNLKFEIEVLCKKLNLEISELRPGNALKSSPALPLAENSPSHASSLRCFSARFVESLLKYRSFMKFWEPPILQGRIHGTELPGVSLKSSLVHSCQFKQLYPTYFAL